MVNQVNAALRSWQARMTSAMKAPIAAIPDLTDAQRRALYKANLRHEWWANAALEPLVIDLMRSSLPLPNFASCRTMAMDASCVTLEAAESGSPHAVWARISRRPGEGTLLIPLGRNRHESTAPGERRNFLQVTVSDRDVIYRVVRNRAKAKIRRPKDPKVLGVDWGMCSMASTSDGRRLGTAVYTWLVARDQQLMALEAALRRQGVRPTDSRRYRRFQGRIREYVRNEVGRIINRLVRDPQLAEIVVEDLDFRSPKLSKRMNRLITRAGRGAWSAKLASLEADTGVSVTAVHAAYTSRACSGCGYVDKRNRPSQAKFRCAFCGRVLNADINGARAIRQRRSLSGIGPAMPRHQVLAQIDEEFLRRWRTDPRQLRERPLRPSRRANGARLAPVNGDSGVIAEEPSLGVETFSRDTG
ncbi:transposase [Gordonia sp. ABSL49_1]|uniref:transposase n=1 Tax=Gordonia sp. ABSL49_1 TaxID=2920941 RepID=UPI001F0E6DDD|nr:transposase [Gordonia sp. ABSL49_1]MCH5643234.1 transposase [Gordonia sp. ABSL49_1]